MLGGVLALPLAACDTDQLVAVEDPGALRPEDLNNLGAVPALVNGAFRQFVGGYSGFGLSDAFIVMGAVLTDEFYYGDTFVTRDVADKRSLQPPVLGNISDAAYGFLHQARFNARRAYGVVDQFSTSQTAAADAVTKAQLRTIEGYVYVTFSEGWCGAVPFSRLPDTGPIDPSAIDFGVSLTTRQMNDTALLRFNEALVLDANNKLAKVGKGRALLNLGRYAEAASAVFSVPDTARFLIEHSTNVSAENNPVNSLQANGRYGISNLEGGLDSTGAPLRPDASAPLLAAASAEGLPYRALRDPRIPWQARAGNGRCFSSSVFCWLNNNYPDYGADIPLASGVEARLIEAEAALQAGDTVLMLTKLDTLRANSTALIARLYPNQKPGFVANPLTPLTDPATAGMTAAEKFAARRDLVFRERALWMFNTGHRLGDLRRLIRNYGLTSAQVFPSGPHFRGGTYGNDVAYPVPFSETNNPQYVPAACVNTAA